MSMHRWCYHHPGYRLRRIRCAIVCVCQARHSSALQRQHGGIAISREGRRGGEGHRGIKGFPLRPKEE